VAKGWGPGTRERQHASRDTIPERWGERTHPRTQAQLSLNRSALAAARLQLPTLASGVGNTSFTFDTSICSRVTGSRIQLSMSLLLSGPVFLPICYCSLWCIYACM
jgi:hypothetical protein